MNGWWWDPEAPGRGFFVEQAEGVVRIACCGYAADGRPEWETMGPVAPDMDGAVVAGGLRLAFRDRDAARLEWAGERIDLRHQHGALRDDAITWDSPASGWWVESDGARIFICEQLNRRLFAALLAADGWLLLEARRPGERKDFSGSWHHFEGGQAKGGPHRPPVGRLISANAVVAPQADGSLLVTPPFGTPIRFKRPAAVSRLARSGATAPEVRFSVPPASKPCSGLAALVLEAEAGGSARDCEYTLVIEPADERVRRHQSRLKVNGWGRKLPLLVNTHLLPNGANAFTARLLAEGEEVWQHRFSLSVANNGPLAERVRASLAASGAPLIIEDAVDSTHFDVANPELAAWFDRPDAMEHVSGLQAAGSIDAAEAGALRQFVSDGYLVVEDAIEEPLLRRIDGELDDAIARRVQDYTFGTSQRIRNLHAHYAGVKTLWKHPRVMRMLELIYGVPARPCQTLTYVFGSQQEAHQDTVHLTPFPQGYMCGVWVALEDVKPDSGELEVFPGSHRLPRIYMSGSGCAKVTDEDWSEFEEKVVTQYRRLLKEGGFRKVTYRPRRGTVLIWHENLLHGGSVRKDTSLSRRSIVSHYFADGAIAYYDSTGRPGSMD